MFLLLYGDQLADIADFIVFSNNRAVQMPVAPIENIKHPVPTLGY